jgi:hypothetical protein
MMRTYRKEARENSLKVRALSYVKLIREEGKCANTAFFLPASCFCFYWLPRAPLFLSAPLL